MRAVLRRPDFRLLFAGLVASMLGDSVLLLALAIWVKDLTGSDGAAGMTLLFVCLPYLAAPLGGWVVDRVRRRPFFIGVSAASALALAPLYAVRDAGDLWIIYLVAAGYGCSHVLLAATLNALLKHLLPDELLADANGVLQTVKQGLRMGGPLLGAALYAAFGGGAIAAFAAGCFLTAAGVVSLLRMAEARPEPSESHWLTEAAAGSRYLFTQAALRRTAVAVALTMLALGFGESLVFAVVDKGLHRPPTFVGVFSSLQGVGSIVGGIAAAWLIRRRGELGAMATGIAAVALGCAAMMYPLLGPVLTGAVVMGAGFTGAVVAFNTVLQRRTPDRLVGRVSGAAEMVITLPQLASIAGGALLVTVVDYRILFAAMAGMMVLAATYLWLGRKLTEASAATEPALAGDQAPALASG